MPWPTPIPAWFWTWARWRLGRGEFRGHGSDPAYRPTSAPTHIPDWAWLRLQALVHGQSPTARDLVVKWALWGVAHEPQIHYSMSMDRDDWLALAPGTLPLTTDCSGFVTLCYRWAKVPDPNGLGYLQLGYTGTLLDYAQDHGRVFTDVGAALPGDPIVMGAATGDHVVLVVEQGNDPLVVSHGEERGPVRQRLSVDPRMPKRVCRTLAP